MSKRNYVGVAMGNDEMIYERFLSAETPTQDKYGHRYALVMGPFRTKAGALAHVHYGHANPHTTTVADCERIARQYADDLKSQPDRRVITY